MKLAKSLTKSLSVFVALIALAGDLGAQTRIFDLDFKPAQNTAAVQEGFTELVVGTNGASFTNQGVTFEVSSRDGLLEVLIDPTQGSDEFASLVSSYIRLPDDFEAGRRGIADLVDYKITGLGVGLSYNLIFYESRPFGFVRVGGAEPYFNLNPDRVNDAPRGRVLTAIPDSRGVIEGWIFAAGGGGNSSHWNGFSLVAVVPEPVTSFMTITGLLLASHGFDRRRRRL